ncbi:SAC3/GANP/Nin1/mts3/eIF-3 p25 family-domain-containing protein [Aspergillus similis]
MRLPTSRWIANIGLYYIDLLPVFGTQIQGFRRKHPFEAIDHRNIGVTQYRLNNFTRLSFIHRSSAVCGSMATPANPFAALHQGQTDGAASSTGRGRGRGGQFRGAASSQPKGPSATQPRGGNFNVSNTRGRGRGRGASSARAGRGARGAGATSNTWRANKPEQQSTSTPSTSSPFSQLKQNQPTPSASPATGPTPQQKPSFSGFGQASPTPFGASSNRGGAAFNARGSQQSPTNPTNEVTTTSVPVEDSSAMGSYNDRYEQLKIDRAKEREQAIKAGQMADPNQPTSLNKAITPVGTCTSMCPEFERVERIVQKMVDKSEKYLHPATNTLQNMEAKMLKRFRRSAAGYDEQLPSDIRTPKTLLQTMNYLTRHVIGGPEPLGIIHKFVWDRTRSIRNDFSVQQLTQEEDVKIAVTCLERIARFHIVSLHLLSSPANEEPFDRHQEREQLNNTMLSLMYYYDDNRGRISFPNEDEFRAYYIIFSIHDQRPDLEARVQKWPPELRNAPRVRVALELFAAAGNTWEYQGTLDSKRPNAIAQGFYTRFFSLVNSPGVSYLMACVAEIYFNHMRQTAIRSIWKGYCRYPSSQQHRNEEWTVDELTSVLCFDDNDQTIQFCAEQDLQFAENANGDLYLNWGSRPVDSVAFQPSSDHSFSENYVEWKRSGRTLVAVVLGLNVKEAATLGMIDKLSLPERGSALASEKQMSIDNDDSLFVSEGENDADPQPTATRATPNGAGPATVFGSRTTDSQPSTNSNPFSSLFAANSTTCTTPSSPSLNPFAKPFTPFSSETSQTSQPVVPSPATTSTGQSSSIFANAGSAGIFAPSQNEQPSAAPAAAPFKYPTISQPATSQTPPTLFQNIQKPTTSPTPPSDASQSTFHVKPDQPCAPTTQTPNNPFAASSSPFSVKPDQPSGAAAGQSSTSISSIDQTFETNPPLFNLNKPSEPSPTVSELHATPEVSNSQSAAFAPLSSPQSGSGINEKGMCLP